jgi:molybdenum cofactor synthesis domain-containing protein
MSAKVVTACLVIIGNEILSGRTRDANLAHIAERLNELGIRLMEARVIPDIEARIVETLNEVRAAYDYVFTTGGIGPTHDDITAESVAKAFGVPLIEHPEARAILEAHYPPGKLTPGRLRMARTPDGASLIENSLSAAPGFHIGNVYVMAGIPAVMQAMFESLAPQLEGGSRLDSLSLTVGIPESVLSAGLGALQQRYPDVEIGSYPFSREGRFAVNIVLRSTDGARLESAYLEAQDLARELGDEPR